ncbi:hypothetical protein A8F94_15285 [Bacillus sp. FJAT-27225]|nr:hypothetical protein A8F94_15285 [Bacillus sp. FJAT-27225]
MKKGFFILLFLLNFIVFVSPFFTKVTVGSDTDLNHMPFGFPFPFLVQDLSSFDPPLHYDMSMSSPWEHPTSINLLSLIASLFVVNVSIYCIYLIIRLQRKN